MTHRGDKKQQKFPRAREGKHSRVKKEKNLRTAGNILKRQSKGDSPDCPSLSGEAPEIRTAVLKAHCEENFNSELGHKVKATHPITRSSLGENTRENM